MEAQILSSYCNKNVISLPQYMSSVYSTNH